MSWLNLFLFCTASAAAYYYYFNLRLREIAILRTKQYCTSMNVQLLDQSVSLKSVRLDRKDTGNLTLSNRYEFEFSTTGEERYLGRITLHGVKVHSIWLQPHRIPDQETSN